MGGRSGALDERADRGLGAANLRFLEKALPTAKIYQAAWHQDENAPHCHLAYIPCDESNRISWRQLSAAAVGMEPPKGKTDKVQRAKIMAAWQDWHHREVGRKFGLERGESGSTRTHEPLTAKKRAAAAEQRRIAAEMERLRAERSALLTAFLAARDAACRISSGVPRWLRGRVSQVWEETTAAARGACAAVGLSWPAGDLVSAVALERENQVDERIAADRDADYRAGYKRAAESVLAEGYQIGLAHRARRCVSGGGSPGRSGHRRGMVGQPRQGRPGACGGAGLGNGPENGKQVTIRDGRQQRFGRSAGPVHRENVPRYAHAGIENAPRIARSGRTGEAGRVDRRRPQASREDPRLRFGVSAWLTAISDPPCRGSRPFLDLPHWLRD